MDVHGQDSIGSLKAKEFREAQSTGRSVRVIFKGKELKSEDTFDDSSVRNNDICHVIIGREGVLSSGSGINTSSSGAWVNGGGHEAGGGDSSLAPQDMLLIAILTISIFFWMILYSLSEQLMSPISTVLLTGITVAASLASVARASQL